MGNSLRCCLACVLPCGALDLIRIVHLNGQVDEITSPVIAGDVLKNYPNHVLSKPCSQGVVRKILILSNNTELKRGSIYFLIPSSSVPENKRNPNGRHKDKDLKKPKKLVTTTTSVNPNVSGRDLNNSDVVVVSENSKKKMGHRRARRAVQANEWKPHLESIFEE